MAKRKSGTKKRKSVTNSSVEVKKLKGNDAQEKDDEDGDAGEEISLIADSSCLNQEENMDINHTDAQNSEVALNENLPKHMEDSEEKKSENLKEVTQEEVLKSNETEGHVHHEQAESVNYNNEQSDDGLNEEEIVEEIEEVEQSMDEDEIKKVLEESMDTSYLKRDDQIKTEHKEENKNAKDKSKDKNVIVTSQNEEFATRSEASDATDLDPNDEVEYEQEQYEAHDDNLYLSDREVDEGFSDSNSNRAISPIIFDCEDEEDINANGDDTVPPGEEDSIVHRRVVIPPAEVRAQRRDRHTKMLKYLFRESRFFLIKSNNHDNVTIAKNKCVWSTPPSNEYKLNKVFQECRNVILIFSVRESGAFQGFARLRSESKHGLSPINWVLPVGLSAKALGGVFEIDWLCKRELSFMRTSDIHNPFNENKPVKIGRDGQEVEPNAGKMLGLEFPHDDGVDLESLIHSIRKREKKLGGPPKYHLPKYPIVEKQEYYSKRKSDFEPKHRTLSNRNDYNDLPHLRTMNTRDRDTRRTYSDPHGNYKNPRSYPQPRTSTANGYMHRRGSYQGQRPQDSSYSRYPSSSADRYQSHYSNGTYNSVHTSSKSYSYSSRPPPNGRASSRYSSGSSNRNRGIDSRSHAAACDDFVRRVAGRSSIVQPARTASRSEYSRISSKSSDRRYESSRSRSDKDYHYPQSRY